MHIPGRRIHWFLRICINCVRVTDNRLAVKGTGRLWTYFNTQGTPSFRLLHNGFLIWENEINDSDPIPVRMIEGLVASQQ